LRSGTWAASVRGTSVRRTTRVIVARRSRTMARTSKKQNRSRFVVSAARGFASAGIRRRATLWRDRGCQSCSSVRPCRLSCCPFQKTREFLESAKRSLVSARDCHNRHTVGMRRKAAYIGCYIACWCARIARPTLDRRFSKSSRVIAKQRVGGFDALYDCALHDGRCRGDTFRTTGRLAQILKTREIWSAGSIVLLLSNHGSVRQYIVADATSRIALSGRLGLVVGVVPKTRRFLE
jgi:hypothetical protein